MKYPRTFHLPSSPGCTSDDKRLSDVNFLFSSKSKVEVVITEKLDGSNTCLTTEGVFARTHAQLASHGSFNLLKSRWSGLQPQLIPGQEIFGENCFAVHTLVYEELPDSFFTFGIRENKKWLSYDQVVERSKELGLMTAPVLFRGYLNNQKELDRLAAQIMKEPSVYGGPREGFVIRVAKGFDDKDFEKSVVKFVRANHVQTDEHWMSKPIVKQKFKV